jgi:hypothetical protein
MIINRNGMDCQLIGVEHDTGDWFYNFGMDGNGAIKL